MNKRSGQCKNMIKIRLSLSIPPVLVGHDEKKPWVKSLSALGRLLGTTCVHRGQGTQHSHHTPNVIRRSAQHAYKCKDSLIVYLTCSVLCVCLCVLLTDKLNYIARAHTYTHTHTHTHTRSQPSCAVDIRTCIQSDTNFHNWFQLG